MTDSRRPAALLSFDFEDWNQLIARELGLMGRTGGIRAFERQTSIVLDLLDELRAKATFFVLGCTAERHAALVQEVAARGHEIGCHGYAHRRVFHQTRDEFRRDVELGRSVVEELVGAHLRGYRAPWFSVNLETPWAYATLLELGFEYDSSHYDSPLVPCRLRPVPDVPFRLVQPGGELLELPLAVWRTRRLSVPVAGGSYWRVLPEPLLLRALHEIWRSSSYLALYFHPHELDPQPLRVSLPFASSHRLRVAALYNRLYADVGRRSLASKIRRVGQAFRFVTYGEWAARIDDGPTRTSAL
jgi:polysaccharide deacetylase family protein (PEP-CTERM system associated)